MAKRTVEIFTAGCPVCDDTVKLVNSVACPSCEVTVYDLNKGAETNVCRDKAKSYGVKRLPAVAVDGKLLECCEIGPVSLDTLKAAGVGTA